MTFVFPLSVWCFRYIGKSSRFRVCDFGVRSDRERAARGIPIRSVDDSIVFDFNCIAADAFGEIRAFTRLPGAENILSVLCLGYNDIGSVEACELG